MDFNKFKEMSQNINDFFEHIKLTSAEYCALNDIDYDPMVDYSLRDCIYDEEGTSFFIHENDITIKWNNVEYVCGDRECEMKTLTIPMYFFNLKNTKSTVFKINIENKINRIKELEQTHCDLYKLTNNLQNEALQLKYDIETMKRLFQKYDIQQETKELEKNLFSINTEVNIKKQEIKKIKLEIEKLKD